jgi:hypothetical protein
MQARYLARLQTRTTGQSKCALMWALLILAVFIMLPATARCGERISDSTSSFSLELPDGWSAQLIEERRISVMGDGFPGKFGVTVRIGSTPEERKFIDEVLTALNLNSDTVLSNGRHLKYTLQSTPPSASAPNGRVTIFGKMDVGKSVFMFQSSSFRRPGPEAETNTKPLLDAVKQIASSLKC